MKVYEIVTEDRQRTDEVAPLVLPVVGAVTIGGLLAGVSAVLTVMDIVEIYKLSKKLATEPDKMTEEDYMDLFISVVFMLPLIKYLPGAIKKSISKAIPNSWKKEGGKKVKEIVDKKRADATPEKGSKLKTVAAVGAGGLAGGAAVDQMTGGTVLDKAKSTFSGTSSSGADSSSSKTIDGSTISKDDPLYKFARWFGRAQ